MRLLSWRRRERPKRPSNDELIALVSRTVARARALSWPMFLAFRLAGDPAPSCFHSATAPVLADFLERCAGHAMPAAEMSEKIPVVLDHGAVPDAELREAITLLAEAARNRRVGHFFGVVLPEGAPGDVHAYFVTFLPNKISTHLKSCFLVAMLNARLAELIEAIQSSASN